MIYYISATGSSGNTGTSDTSPWDISKFTSFNFPAGSNIIFKRGDSWTGAHTFAHSGTSGNPITIGAYGYGANPVFDAANAGAPVFNFTNQNFITISDIVIQNNDNVGILLFNCHDITISNLYITHVTSGINAVNCTGNIVIDSNYMLNMQGPFPKGSHVQFNNVSGSGNKIINNKLWNVFGSSQSTDIISLYQSNGISGSPILVDNNHILGGDYPTGAGISTADSGGSYQTVSNNIIVNAAAVGVDITAGDHISLINNKVYGQQNTWTNVGLYVWAQKGTAPVLQPITNATVSGNRVNWKNHTGAPNSHWLASGEAVPAGWLTNIWDDPTINASMLPNPLWTGSPWNNNLAIPVPIINYSPASYVFTQNVAISTISPINTGGAPASYAISPALPTGLSFNTTTGVITGTPTVISANQSYAITATNTSGSNTTHISIQVKIPLPVISYSPSSEIYLLNTAITPITPSNTGGAATAYAISHALPTGLSFNTTTGAISGTPTITSPATTYTVTATNASGSATTTITITVNTITVNTTAPNISYSPSTEIFVQKTAITPLTPTNIGGAIASYAISPSQLFGLNFDTMTGIVSGIPITLSTATVYTVTATNVTGTSTTHITLSVVAKVPVLHYVPAANTYIINSPIIVLAPINTGGAPASYAISPGLPTGLSFNTSTGIITGTPTVLHSITTYTVTATKTGGSGSTTFTITVVAAPSPDIKKKRMRFI